MVLVTTTDHTAAVLARLNAVKQDWMAAARLDDAVALGTDYIEVTTERRYLADPRVYPGTSMRLWRITCLWVASTVGNADSLEATCHEALEGVSLAIGGDTTTPIQHETTDPTVQEKDRRWSGFVEFTYSL